MCVLCDYKTPQLRNLSEEHIRSKIDGLTKLHAQSLLEALPPLQQECVRAIDQIVLPEKKRQIDDLINHLEHLTLLLSKKISK